MCGIIGYIGNREARHILLNGLKKLEYRGYDSWGLATIQENIIMKKSIGKISENQIYSSELKGKIGIAHTRWATHGGITEENTHPHTSCNGEIAIVHNGIIDNYEELKRLLSDEGHKFTSQTDSEVIAHLLEKYYKNFKNIKKALLSTIKKIKGTFSFLAIFSNDPNLIVGVRKDSPLVLGVGEDGLFLASDVLPLIQYTDKVVFLDNSEIVIVAENFLKIFDFKGKEVKKSLTQVAWEVGDTSKKEFTHYTLKEIYEQSGIIKNLIIQDQTKLKHFCKNIKEAKKLFITAAGTSYHAALLARYFFSKISKIYCEAILASEFSQIIDWVDEDTVILAISQSGETADVLHTIREAKQNGAKILSIVNVMGSTLDRESNLSLYLNCGPEIGVAATKSFMAQIVLIYLLTNIAAYKIIPRKKLKNLEKYIETILKVEDTVKEIAEKYKDSNDFFFIGRSIHYPIALEGALKLKELSYIHAEGMAAGELKHGTLALIDVKTPVVVLNPKDDTYHETLSNVLEMKVRGAKIIGISNIKNEAYDDFIPSPKIEKLFYPMIEVIPLQMLAYHMAICRGTDVDKPRNLAKSVTVK
ncbi:MAG: glutamine--fructose-6-phosphate transaminase (isomerizing) [Candidatus Methylarchaceae archaeon HK02M2]|nr:glutamine--fructose-6-phosphate transaminase (isomerizing) [Candidatus Methylarchaceae archaeon HK02M2]